jgi:hypothetical protein
VSAVTGVKVVVEVALTRVFGRVRPLGLVVGGGVSVQPRGLPATGGGQVQGEVAAFVPGDAGGHGDEVAPQGGPAGAGVDGVGQAAEGAQQVVGDGGAG